jgi:hypothetical protein
MIISNSVMRAMPEHKEEVKEETKTTEVETTNVSAESMNDLAKMVAAMLSASVPTNESYLHEKYHELDKRISVCEALIKHLGK